MQQQIRRNTWFHICLFVLSAIAFGDRASAQTFYGSVVGTVSDASGSAIPGAAVTITNTGTAERRSAETDARGNYLFVNLVPGTYRVDIEKPGFQHLARPDVQVEVQAAVRIDATLQVGEVTQTMEVTAQTPLLQTENASLSQVVEGRTVQETPLNGRNVLNLVELSPGVVPQGSSTGNPMGNQSKGSTTNPNGWGNYQIGGGMANQSGTYLDGAPLNVSYVNSTVLVPTQDAIQEFRIATNNVSPEFGRFAGGIVNLTTKSGTNSLHGGAYEYLRNRVLNANDFFNNRSNIARPPFTQNQFGANAGGPVKRDKTFFFFSWEDFKYRQGIPTLTTVPTQAMRNGDFSAAGIPAIYDPLSTMQTAPGVYTRTPFPGNMIPANRIDATAKVMQNYWALPNQPGLINNWAGNGKVGGDQYQLNARGDQNISESQRLFARYTRWIGNTIPNDIFNNKSSGLSAYYSTDQAVIGDTYTISPSTIADVRGSFLRFRFGFTPPSIGSNLSEFGPAWAALQNQMTFTHFPGDTVNGYFGFPQFVIVRNVNNVYSLSENVTKIAGTHTIKIGAEHRLIEWNYGQTNNASGSFNFDNRFTAQNPLAPTGSGF
ncbi:MAG: carboxypeptidase regulatory-like domain-containing protein, partial [Acidobacteriaceae bacterium]|nr:carboxypeptidase regulatory-like domain-containing protein [Acidobacteriaceae bacterium]